jgi:predicted alpha/beta-hydrolase family hydrolase
MNPEAAPEPRLIDGLDASPVSVLLAHGAGAPMDSQFMARMRETGRRQAPDRMPVLQEAFRQQVRPGMGERPERALFIGGKSMAGRVASLLIDELAVSDGVRGCMCLGYPFHPPGKPLQLRTEHLAGLRTPTLILQGERDSFGRRGEVETYSLSPQVQLG